VVGRRSSLKLTTALGSPIVVTVEGSLDLATVNQLEEVVTAVLTPGASVVLDLSGLAMCDSTGLGALVRLRRHASAVDGQFALRRPRPHVAGVLAMTGINKVIPVLDA
jgi:anti-sigma B factor antagonist